MSDDEKRKRLTTIPLGMVLEGVSLLGQDAPPMVPPPPSELPYATVGRKNDAGKPNWDLMPLKALEPVVRVLEHGAAKYSVDNWRTVPGARGRYYAAAMRHLAAWHAGEDADPETGISHLGHAICSLMFVLAKEAP